MATTQAPPLPASMPAAVYRGSGEVAVEDRPVPQPGAGEVLVEVGHCGICGSDLYLIGENLGSPGTVMGHEYSGVVAALGEVPEGLAGGEAARAEPLAVALHGITRSHIRLGDTAMVMGAGPIGALTVAALLARGFGPVAVVEPAPPRQAPARALGAEVLEPGDLPTYPLWEPEQMSPLAVDVVLECSGRKAAMEAGFHQLRRGGHMGLGGPGMEPPPFDPNRMLLNELTVTGAFVYDADGFDRALELLATPGAIPTELLIEAEDIGLDRVGQAVRQLAAGETAGKVLVAPGLALGAHPTPQEA